MGWMMAGMLTQLPLPLPLPLLPAGARIQAEGRGSRRVSRTNTCQAWLAM
jgi:hypothetical protein